MTRSKHLSASIALLLAQAASVSADNFLTNGDAEAGTLAPWLAIPAGVAGAVPQVSQATGVVTPFSGKFFFTFTGSPAQKATMHQEGATGTQQSALRLSGMVQTETALGSTDVGEAILTIYDSAGSVLNSASTGPLVTPNFQWQPFEVVVAVPAGAALWRVDLDGFLFSGSFINVFWDELTLEPCSPGDLNGDCVVGVADLLLLLAAWGQCADCDECPADLTGDCTVGVADLLVLLANWG